MLNCCSCQRLSTTCKSFWTASIVLPERGVVLWTMSWGLTVMSVSTYPAPTFAGLCPHRHYIRQPKGHIYIPSDIGLAICQQIVRAPRTAGVEQCTFGGLDLSISWRSTTDDVRANVPLFRAATMAALRAGSVCISKPKASWLTTSNGSINVIGE